MAALCVLILLVACFCSRSSEWLGLRPSPTSFTLSGATLEVHEPYCGTCCCPVPCYKSRRIPMKDVAEFQVFEQAIHYTVRDVGGVAHGGPAVTSHHGRVDTLAPGAVPEGLPTACDMVSQPCIMCCSFAAFYCCDVGELPSKQCAFVGARVRSRDERAPTVVPVSSRVYQKCLVTRLSGVANRAQEWLAAWRVHRGAIRAHHDAVRVQAEAEGLPPGGSMA